MSAPKVRLLELRNTYKWGGGPDKTILLSAKRHSPSRVKVVVAYVRDGRDGEFQVGDRAGAKGLTFYDIQEYGKLDFRVLAAVRRIILEHDINLVHSHDYKSDLFAYLVRRWLWRRRIALMSTAHAWVILGTRGDLYRKLDLLLMRRFDQLIAVSHSTKKEMIDAGVPAASIEVIHNAIDTDAWSIRQVARNIREPLGLTGAFPVVGYVGRIMPEKDLATWLRAAAVLSTVHPSARFVLVGDGRDGRTQQELEGLTVYPVHGVPVYILPVVVISVSYDGVHFLGAVFGQNSIIYQMHGIGGIIHLYPIYRIRIVRACAVSRACNLRGIFFVEIRKPCNLLS
jgi:glycosyltransferase involved in cell wall biosynthesis